MRILGKRLYYSEDEPAYNIYLGNHFQTLEWKYKCEKKTIHRQTYFRSSHTLLDSSHVNVGHNSFHTTIVICLAPPFIRGSPSALQIFLTPKEDINLAYYYILTCSSPGGGRFNMRAASASLISRNRVR